MLSDLTSSAKYPEVKRAAKDRERWRATEREEERHKPASRPP